MTAWGKIIATTGSLANTVGANQPFRYRGYVYDEETQWYYLQSRYYDPAVRRFISADVLLSTGQGVLGHNAFAYCNNNPVALADDEGSRPYAVQMTDSGSGNAAYYAHYLIELHNRKTQQFWEKSFSFITNDEQVVFDRGNRGCAFTIYKGTPVFYFEPTDFFEASFTPGPFILLATNDLNAGTLNHEYGHVKQFGILGLCYYTKIAIPSVVCSKLAGLNNGNNFLYRNYFSLPCERSADLLGGADRTGYNYITGSETISMIYLLWP